MENIEKFSTGKEAKEIEEFVEAYLKLQAQINNPTRNGMIKALLDAKNVAPHEISTLESSQGEIYPTSSDYFEFEDLYRKLTQYRQGLYIHAVNKFGEEVVKNLLKTLNEQNQKQHKIVLNRRIAADKGQKSPQWVTRKKCARGRMIKRRSIAIAERTIKDFRPMYILCCLNMTSIFQRWV